MRTPPSVADRWVVIAKHSMDRSCRDWVPGVANAEFESLLESLAGQHLAVRVLATDGSVTKEPPRTGWGSYLRADRDIRRSSRACRLVLSSMKAEIEAVTLGLSDVAECAQDADLLIIATDSQSLLRRLEAGWSPPEWWDSPTVKTIWVYCPGHAGIGINETADRLAAGGAGETTWISLSVADVKQLLLQKQREARERTEPPGSAEIERMAGRGLGPGWVRRSRRCGATGRMACQLATGTISRRTLADVIRLGDAEAAWARCFEPRPPATLLPRK